VAESARAWWVRVGDFYAAAKDADKLAALINRTLAMTGLRDSRGDPLAFTPHDFRRLFATDARGQRLPRCTSPHGCSATLRSTPRRPTSVANVADDTKRIYALLNR
jgi:hypothetical protein